MGAAAPLGAAGGPPPYFVKRWPWNNYTRRVFYKFDPPENMFSRMFRGSSEIVDFGTLFTIFENFPGTLPNPANLYFVTIFHECGVL